MKMDFFSELLQNATNEPDLMEKGVQTETEQSPTAAHVGDIQSTPGEDETMNELYERPSQSPPTEIDQDQLPVASEESNSLDHVENIDEVITGEQSPAERPLVRAVVIPSPNNPEGLHQIIPNPDNTDQEILEAMESTVEAQNQLQAEHQEQSVLVVENLTKEEQATLAAQKMALKMGILPSNGTAVVANFHPNPASRPKPKHKSRWDVQ